MRGHIIRKIICSIALFFSCWSLQAEEMTSAHLNYILHCQGCHLSDGAGTPGKIPALKQEVGRFLQVDGGREFLIQVPGTAQSALSDNEVAGVLNWILDNFSPNELPVDFAPYTKEEITRYRQPLANVAAVRMDLVAQLSTQGKNATLE